MTTEQTSIWAAVHRLSHELAADVAQACALAHARYVPWRGESQPAGDPPSLLVAGLSAGERRVPEDVLELATRSYPGLSLLLLCSEPLVRPAMALQNGRITLLARPFTPGKLASRIRALTATRAGTPLRADRPPDASVALEERVAPHFWVASLAAPGADDAPLSPPWLSAESGEGLTAILSPPDRLPLDDTQLQRALAAARANDGEQERVFAEALGPDAALLHLSADAREWTLYWPRPDWGLWLFSPLRLPPLCDLSSTRAETAALFRFPAAGGDLLLAASGPLPEGQHGALGLAPELAAALEDGGPAALDWLTQRAAGAGAFSGVLVEVR